MFETPKIAGHVAVDKRDPDAGVDGKPAVLPGEHVGRGRDHGHTEGRGGCVIARTLFAIRPRCELAARCPAAPCRYTSPPWPAGSARPVRSIWPPARSCGPATWSAGTTSRSGTGWQATADSRWLCQRRQRRRLRRVLGGLWLENTPLHKTVSENLESWLAWREEAKGPLPGYVEAAPRLSRVRKGHLQASRSLSQHSSTRSRRLSHQPIQGRIERMALWPPILIGSGPMS